MLKKKMTYEQKYYEWACKVAAIIDKNKEEYQRNNAAIVAVCVSECVKLEKNVKRSDFGLTHYLRNDLTMGFSMHLCQD